MRTRNKELVDSFSIFKGVMERTGKISGKKIYTDALILWMGVCQSLELCSCRGVMPELFTERAFSLMGSCARKVKGNLSVNVAALIQSRQKVSRESLIEVLNELYKEIRGEKNWKGYRVFGIDGSTVSLNRTTAALRKAYPGGRDHIRTSRWPIIHLVMLIDLLNGKISSANIGAKCGDKVQGEQELSLVFKGLIGGKSILIGDRNFGTFNIAKEFSSTGADVLVRLKEDVAKRIATGVDLKGNADVKVEWISSNDVADKYGYARGEKLSGRIIVSVFKHKNKIHKVYLFTTLKIGKVSELAELYRKRWYFEEDLKSIKLRLRLKDIQAETKTAVEVELFCKLMAYNITRAMILLAVKGTDIDPRRISFATALTITRARLLGLQTLHTKEREKEFRELLMHIRCAINPVRPNRSYPRAVYGRRSAKYKVISSAI